MTPAEKIEYDQWLRSVNTQRLLRELESERQKLINSAEREEINETDPKEPCSVEFLRSRLSRAYQLRKVIESINNPQ